MDGSLFKLYSFGIAAENKALDSLLLEVTPIEVNPYLSGELLPNPTEISDQGTNRDNREYTVKVTSANSLSCKWLQWGSNRKTPPDVRRGERILIYSYADTDEFYWISAGLDDHLRRLETACFLFSATTDESTKTLTPENAYCFEVSTHNKTITLSTSKANGEPFAYVFQFNTGEGCFVLADDNQNLIQLESEERIITIQNKDTTKVVLDKKNLDMFAPDTITMKSKNLIIENENTIHKTKSYETSAVSWTVKVNNTTWTGNKTFNGTYSGTGGASFSGTFNHDGNFIQNGVLMTSGHTHSNGNNGNPTGSVIPG